MAVFLFSVNIQWITNDQIFILRADIIKEDIFKKSPKWFDREIEILFLKDVPDIYWNTIISNLTL